MISKPKAIDLFCGAGGTSMGYHQAGFDMTGVDITNQPNYPFKFIQIDALKIDLSGYDCIFASPPCQGYTWATKRHRNLGKEYPELIIPTRKMLQKTNKPYVIENVIGAPLKNTIMLCGKMFDLGVIRHRLFETNFPISQPKHRKHNGTVKNGDYVTVASCGSDGKSALHLWKKAMSIDWMTRNEIKQAIPPAYTKYIGEILMQHIRSNFFEV